MSTIFIVLFAINSYAEVLNTISIVLKNPSHIYSNVQYEFNKTILDRQYKKWQKLNTGNYVYILESNSSSYQLKKFNKKIIFIENNSLKVSIDLNDIKNKKTDIKKEFYYLKREHSNKKHCGTQFQWQKHFYNSLSLDYRFPKVRGLKKSNICKNVKLEYEFDIKYGYIDYEEIKCMGVPNSKSTVSYIYGFMMLPKDITYTNELIDDIINKYKIVFECINKHSKKQKYSNMTKLEKAVGKDTLKCFNKYLIWDKNDKKEGLIIKNQQ